MDQTDHPTDYPTDSPYVIRRLITSDPFAGVVEPDAWGAAVWPGSWVWLGDGETHTPIVAAFCCRFRTSEGDGPIRLHITADEQYELFFDGRFTARGPERGDGATWYYDSYEVNPPAGEHVLVARVWALGETDYLSPAAQMSIGPGFLVAAEGDWSGVLSTGSGHWQAMRLKGYHHLPPPMTEAGQFAGGFQQIDGRLLDWGFQQGLGDRWRDVVVIEAGQSRRFPYGELYRRRRLAPAHLPPRIHAVKQLARVRFAATLADQKVADTVAVPVRLEHHDPDAAESFSTMLTGNPNAGRAVVPANTVMRVIIDAQDYLTGYPELTVSGGANAVIHLHWAESLFKSPRPAASGDAGDAVDKGHRDEIDGKYFRGKGDTFITDGAEGRTFSTLWWRAGRYLQLIVEAKDEPLHVDRLIVRQTYYPLADHWEWASDDPRLDAAVPIMRRALRASMHDQFTDCPYYEQLMYTGDTRLEALTCYLLSRDDRLARKAIRLKEASRLPNGLTQARFPCFNTQIIPGFCLWWVGMVYDYALWRSDREFVRAMMPGVRSVIEAWHTFRNRDGLVEAPDGWNFVDWAKGWPHGCPPGAMDNVNATMNWQFAWTLMLKAELELWLSEHDLAERDRRDARRLAEALTGACWDPALGLFKETPGVQTYSEHAQCMALLSGLLDNATYRRVLDGLTTHPDLDRCTIYFSFYLMEALGRACCADAFFDKLRSWYGLKDLGLVCTPESPEPTRSDCHAWGAHPLYHLYATILGMRPAGLGTDELTIRPMLGPLQHIAGRCAHPLGEVSFDLKRHNGRITGYVELPSNVSATFIHADGRRSFTGRVDV